MHWITAILEFYKQNNVVQQLQQMPHSALVTNVMYVLAPPSTLLWPNTKTGSYPGLVNRQDGIH